ncbi:hypothetical protein GCM10027291_17410 [Telluribacter humicola]
MLLSLLLLSLSIPSYAQNWRPDFRIPLGPEAIWLQYYNELSHFWAKGTDVGTVDRCKIQVSMFYFRVNSQGEIDSIYTQGNLNRSATEAVYKNIYETEGKWVLPKDTKSTDSCWFIYPFFAFGSSRSCSDELLADRYPLSLLYQQLSVLKSTEDQRGRVLLHPSPYSMFAEK